MSRVFRAAPWSGMLIGVSTFVTLLMLGVAYGAHQVIPAIGAAHIVGTLVVFVPLLVIPAALLFVVREFALEGDELRIKRLFWHTVISLQGISRAEHDPSVLKGSVRVAGNGGLFSFCGRFRNSRLGFYRAFVTDWRNSVVLILPGAVVVLSPEDPQRFLAVLQQRYPSLRLLAETVGDH